MEFFYKKYYNKFDFAMRRSLFKQVYSEYKALMTTNRG